MSKVRFTAGRIDAFTCPSDKGQTHLWDIEVPGLGLRCTNNGSKAYVFQIKSKATGGTMRKTIGSPSAWSLSQAREEARRLRVAVDQGRDPRKEEAEALANKKIEEAIAANELAIQTTTARAAWDDYLDAPHARWGERHRTDHINASKAGGEECKIGKRTGKAGPLAFLLCKPLNSITDVVIADWLSIESKERPTSVQNSYRKFRTFVRWCSTDARYRDVVRADCCTSPIARANLPANRARTDALSKAHLELWFKAVKEIPNQTFAAYIQCLLLTGARRGELEALRWKDIDFPFDTLKLKDKIDGERTISLTPFVKHLIETQPEVNDYVFSSPTSKSGHIESPSKAYAKAINSVGLPRVSLHGLRRSFKTLSEWLEPPAGVVAQIMGHKPSATAEKYYTVREPAFLLIHHEKIEQFILKEAKIKWTKLK